MCHMLKFGDYVSVDYCGSHFLGIIKQRIYEPVYSPEYIEKKIESGKYFPYVILLILDNLRCSEVYGELVEKVSPATEEEISVIEYRMKMNDMKIDSESGKISNIIY